RGLAVVARVRRMPEPAHGGGEELVFGGLVVDDENARGVARAVARHVAHWGDSGTRAGSWGGAASHQGSRHSVATAEAALAGALLGTTAPFSPACPLDGMLRPGQDLRFPRPPEVSMSKA